MTLDTLITAGGALMLGTAFARAVVAAGVHAREKLETATRQRRDVAAFRERAESLFKRLDPARPQAFTSRQDARPFRVVRRVHESPDKAICSFYLEPVDRQPVPAYRPGQFLSFVIPTNGNGAGVQRCYSLSEAPMATQAGYRVSIKRIQYPGTSPGLASNYFHDQLSEGRIVNVLPPAGSFCLDQTSSRPIVLIAGGIGITPLLSMLSWLVATNSQREIWLFHGVRNRADHAFQKDIAKLNQGRANVRCVTFYSRPTRACRRGIDFDVEGHISVDVIKALLKARNYEFYLCGPPAMMARMQTGLVRWGVPAEDIRTEQFGSPAPNRSAPQRDASPATNGSAEPVFQVDFLRSGKSVAWSAQNGSLLELAEACGINARHSCRAGQCGTCKVRLKSGNIIYRAEPALPPETGTCLPCISQPASNLSVDM
ncbi:MAG: 2Fe-2S iron-sulfur cluster-binding protein [Hyphomicrobiaceae bacterium]